MDVDRSGIDRILVAPDLPKESVSGEDNPRMPNQVGQQIEFFGFEEEFLVSDSRFSTGKIDLDVASFERRGFVIGIGDTRG
jgi:hypothetical protein